MLLVISVALVVVLLHNNRMVIKRGTSRSQFVTDESQDGAGWQESRGTVCCIAHGLVLPKRSDTTRGHLPLDCCTHAAVHPSSLITNQPDVPEICLYANLA